MQSTLKPAFIVVFSKTESRIKEMLRENSTVKYMYMYSNWCSYANVESYSELQIMEYRLSLQASTLHLPSHIMRTVFLVHFSFLLHIASQS